MGVSTDAYLTLGIPLDDGFINEWLFSDQRFEDSWALSKYLEDTYGCNLVEHCSEANVMHILAILDKIWGASRGEVGIVNPHQLTITAQDRENLKKACQFLSISYHEPQWCLVSWWG